MADVEDGEDATSRAFAPPVTVINLLQSTVSAHYQLSLMADQKASILMGATFVIFTITVGQSHGGANAPLPLLILGAFAFVSAVFAMMAVLPTIGNGRSREPINMLFFGSFTDLDRQTYIERLLDTIGDEESAYRAMARALYDNGHVLRRKKYRWLGYAYRVFIAGLTVSLVAFVVQFVHYR